MNSTFHHHVFFQQIESLGVVIAGCCSIMLQTWQASSLVEECEHGIVTSIMSVIAASVSIMIKPHASPLADLDLAAVVMVSMLTFHVECRDMARWANGRSVRWMIRNSGKAFRARFRVAGLMFCHVSAFLETFRATCRLCSFSFSGMNQ